MAPRGAPGRTVQEMYADVDARGGILEPPGIVEVKYRAHQQALAPLAPGYG